MSPQYSLTTADLKKWGTNLLIFLAPVVLIYLLSVIAVVNSAGVSVAAFVPAPATVGAMVLYVLNGIVDLIRKYVAGPLPTANPTTPPSTQ
jgi:cell shape-determining protein MreC